jgi:hypothetical protein
LLRQLRSESIMEHHPLSHRGDPIASAPAAGVGERLVDNGSDTEP